MRHTGLHNQGLWWMTLTAPGGATSNIHCATSVAHVRLGFSRASGITGGRSPWLTLLCLSSLWSCTSLVVPHSETQKGSTTMSPSERTGWVKQDLAGSSSRQVCRLELLLYNINIMDAWRFVNESLCSYLQQLMIGFKLPRKRRGSIKFQLAWFVSMWQFYLYQLSFIFSTIKQKTVGDLIFPWLKCCLCYQKTRLVLLLVWNFIHMNSDSAVCIIHV